MKDPEREQADAKKKQGELGNRGRVQRDPEEGVGKPGGSPRGHRGIPGKSGKGWGAPSRERRGKEGPRESTGRLEGVGAGRPGGTPKGLREARGKRRNGAPGPASVPTTWALPGAAAPGLSRPWAPSRSPGYSCNAPARSHRSPLTAAAPGSAPPRRRHICRARRACRDTTGLRLPAALASLDYSSRHTSRVPSAPARSQHRRAS